MADGASAEIALVGNEAVIGIALFMGGKTMPNRAVVQSAGCAYQLQGRLLKEEFNRAGELQHLLLCYTQALLTQMSQTACASATILWNSNCAAGYCLAIVWHSLTSMSLRKKSVRI